MPTVAPTVKKPAPKKKPMGMRSTAPQMQGPISGGAGGGFTQFPAPGMSGAPQINMQPFTGGPSQGRPAMPQRGPMPLPPSAAPRPAPPMMGPPMRPGPMPPGGPQGVPFQGGGFAPPGQSPTGPPMGPPPMMGGGGMPPRGMMPGAGGMDRFGGAGPMKYGGLPPQGPQTPLDQIQAARGAMGGMQKPMMGSIGQPPPQGGMPQQQQRPDIAAMREQMMQARGGQPQF